ncbi:MAG TPA: hypothetical protein ENJ29_02460 [Bacteroidetes bacterium]|nr:hypothetical protein [Bacteroidota bacterium]
MPVPKEIERLYEQEKWPELILVFRKKWDEKGWLYLKQNKNAVQRVKQEFTRLTRRPPYNHIGNARYWDEQIGKFCARLGVKALIEDMRAAVPKYKPRSIVYFLFGSGGKASRWEMLLRQQIARELQEQKEKDNEAYQALYRLLGFAPAKPVQSVPDWVLDARKRLRALQQTPVDCVAQMRELEREISRIKHNLKVHGYDDQ